jgi:hypothetical protein
VRLTRATVLALGAAGLLLVSVPAQERLPTARLVQASRLVMPGQVDSNVPMTWDLVDGEPQLFATTSWGGIPALLRGNAIDRMQRIADSVTIVPHPGDGVWIEAIVPDDGGVWYGYYHHEQPAARCGRGDRAIPRIGAARSADHGYTWDDLGIIIELSQAHDACGSSNRFVLGGAGDLTAMLDADGRDLYLYYSQYGKEPSAQGVALARLAWADRDAPVGQADIWHDGAWLPPSPREDGGYDAAPGTAMIAPLRPWHDGNGEVDAFWGPSIHWNTYLERYVMLVNRARNEQFDNDGIYVAYADRLDDPHAWSAPRKIMNGGGWYPQVAGLEAGSGTDKRAGRRARLFLTGKSDQFIEFDR